MKTFILIILAVLFLGTLYYWVDNSYKIKYTTIKRDKYLIKDSTQAIKIFKAYIENYNYTFQKYIISYKYEVYRDSVGIVKTKLQPYMRSNPPYIVINIFNGKVIDFNCDDSEKEYSPIFDTTVFKKHIDSLLKNDK